MNTPFTVKVPFELARRLLDVLDKVVALHDAEVEKIGKKVGMAGASEALKQKQIDLKERSKRLTVHHLLRACIVAGANVLDKKPEEILKLVAEDSVRVGRPAHGPRAA